jgi:hypothetical protein
MLLLLLLLGAPAWQGICSWGTLRWVRLSGRLIAYQPPQEGLAAAKAKRTTKEPISIEQQSIQAPAPTPFDSAATADGFD